jgi:hypothetical protein
VSSAAADERSTATGAAAAATGANAIAAAEAEIKIFFAIILFSILNSVL